MFSQTQQSYSMLFIDLGRHVSIPLESSSGPLWKIQIHYIELLKHVMRSQTFTTNLCSQSKKKKIENKDMCIENISLLWTLWIYIFRRGPDDDFKEIETCRPRSINNILYDCCVWLNIVFYRYIVLVHQFMFICNLFNDTQYRHSPTCTISRYAIWNK